jgi:hypothetical protein
VLGCVVEPVLVPARGAIRVRGSETQALAEEAGVRIWVDGAAWHGDPADLGELMTPVGLAIENGTTQWLREGVLRSTPTWGTRSARCGYPLW